MKNHISQTANMSSLSSISTHVVNASANLLRKADFTDSAFLLDYSVRPLREEPLELVENSSISQHIWSYSPEF